MPTRGINSSFVAKTSFAEYIVLQRRTIEKCAIDAKIPLPILLGRGIHFRYKLRSLHLANLMS